MPQEKNVLIIASEAYADNCNASEVFGGLPDALIFSHVAAAVKTRLGRNLTFQDVDHIKEALAAFGVKA